MPPVGLVVLKAGVIPGPVEAVAVEALMGKVLVVVVVVAKVVFHCSSSVMVLGYLWS